MLSFLVQYWREPLWSGGILAVSIVLALVVRWILLWLLRRLARTKGASLGQSLVKYDEEPTRWIFPLIGFLPFCRPFPCGLLQNWRSSA